MATETTLVYFGHLLVNSILKDLCRRQNQLCETHSLVLKNIWLVNFEKKSVIYHGKWFPNTVFRLQSQLQVVSYLR